MGAVGAIDTRQYIAINTLTHSLNLRNSILYVQPDERQARS